jgi:DNA processing protein
VSYAGTLHDRREVAARLALLAAPRLNAATVISLTERHGSGRAALDHLRSDCGVEVADGLRSPAVRERVVRALAAIESQGLRVLPFDDPAYPPLLRARLDGATPPLLFARGNLAALQIPGIAAVGCRHASEYGLDIAEQIGGATARAGACLVSGVALGIDAAAHSAALDADGTTIGVLGCGVDVYYPRRNTMLQDRIASCGLLLSELLPGEPPRRHQFPHRNRIIAALSCGVVVVEAGVKSGALSTALHAMEQGVPLFAVPNAINRPNVQGILGLFEDGVPAYTGVRTLLESCGVIGVGESVPERDMEAEYAPVGALNGRVWAALGGEAMHADGIARAAGISAPDALVTLLQLELDGQVVQQAGGRFSRRRQSRNRSVQVG